MCIRVGVEHWKKEKSTVQGHFNLSNLFISQCWAELIGLNMFDDMTFCNRAEQSEREWKNEEEEERGQSDQKKGTGQHHAARDEQML